MNAPTIAVVAVVLLVVNLTIRHIINQVEPAPSPCPAPASSSLPASPSSVTVELDANSAPTAQNRSNP